MVYFSSFISIGKRSSENIVVWHMEGIQEIEPEFIAKHAAGEEVKGVADFDGDGDEDVLGIKPGGDIGVRLMDGTEETGRHYIGNHEPWELR